MNWRRSHHVIALPTDALLARDGRPGTDDRSLGKVRDRQTTGLVGGKDWLADQPCRPRLERGPMTAWIPGPGRE